MSNKKQSSLEFFAKMLVEQGLLYTNDFENLITYQKAKAMHKEEIINAANNGCEGMCYLDSSREGQQYYNETFGGQDNE